MIREKIAQLVAKSIQELQKEKKLPSFSIPDSVVEKPQQEGHGDYATNVAMQLAKVTKKNPIEIATLITQSLNNSNTQSLFDRVEVVKPGFINFFLTPAFLQKQVSNILKNPDPFTKKSGKKVHVEFISANPTGPLTLGNGRGGFCGDVTANVLEKAGYDVEREYYINDVGKQIRVLGHSVLGDDKAVYKGKYIDELRKKIVGGPAHIPPAAGSVAGGDPERIGEKATAAIIKDMIKPTVKRMGITFDVWFSEKSLSRKKEVDRALAFLKKKKLTYEKEGAVWFRSTQFGDDKDRVLVRENGETTYFASDVAHIMDKQKRKFDSFLIFLGADHAGYVRRMQAAAEAVGYGADKAHLIVMQLVKLFQKGKEVRMSKRAGTYVTLDELIDEVGLDAARFFFLTRSADSHLNFDMDLAKEQSQKNPVYYVQYAHARIASILKKAKKKTAVRRYELLTHPTEHALVKQLIRFPEIITDTAADYQVQRVPQYATDVADAFHRFYEQCRVLGEEKELREARIGLVLATQVVLKGVLDLMGITAPKKM